MRLQLLFWMAASTLLLHADPVLLIQPQPGGRIQVAPGAINGWGFEMTGDPLYWISITGSQMVVESNPGIGSYVDLIGTQGGPSAGALAPNATWSQPVFSEVLGEGLGQYWMGPGVAPGTVNEGTIWVFYESFSADPSGCGGACLVGSGILSVPFEVSTPSAVPEPSTWAGGVVAGVLALAARRRRQ